MNKKIIIGILFFVIVVVVALLLLPSNETSQKTGGVENTLFEFYGKVTDQEGNPVSDVSIKILNINTPSDSGTIQEAQSDNDGLFLFKGNGSGIGVEVSKEGYAVTEQSNGNFRYVINGSGGLLTKENPAIFVLRSDE